MKNQKHLTLYHSRYNCYCQRGRDILNSYNMADDGTFSLRFLRSIVQQLLAYIF